MKFAVALAVASTASTAMAGMVVPRDASIVTAVISTAGKDIDAVKAAADAYKGDKTDLVSAADKLVSDLKDGKSKVAGGPDLTVVDAANLAQPVSDLAAKGSALTDSLTSRKADVEKAGECKTVQDQISSIYSASNDLITAVVAKVPEAAQGIAKSLASQLTDVLQKAQDSYKDCKDGSSGGSSTGGSTPTSTASSGSATGTATGTSTAAPTSSATGTKTGGASTGTSSSGAASSTGGVKPTSTSPPVAGAAMYAPAGILAAVAAVLAL